MPDTKSPIFKFTGYRDPTPGEIDLVNETKELAEVVRRHIDKVTASDSTDPRWANITITHLQQGFMALVRSITKPTSF